jgi:hypothetical protein
MNESLPSNRVFLIRLSSGAGPSAGNHRGRIEHIRSGRTKRVSSLNKVEESISEVLSEEERGVEPKTASTGPKGNDQFDPQ